MQGQSHLVKGQVQMCDFLKKKVLAVAHKLLVGFISNLLDESSIQILKCCIKGKVIQSLVSSNLPVRYQPKCLIITRVVS